MSIFKNDIAKNYIIFYQKILYALDFGIKLKFFITIKLEEYVLFLQYYSYNKENT